MSINTGGAQADDIIARLRLTPHPEGGHYRETWASEITDADGRPSGTAIYFLLKAGEESRWHSVDATEIWLYHTGAPLELSLADTRDGPAETYLLGTDLDRAAPQILVPPLAWQKARSTGDFTLVSCTVSPGFRFEGFTLAEPGFDIPSSGPSSVLADPRHPGPK